MKNQRFLWIGLSVSISLYLITLLFELDLFEKTEAFFRRFERFEVDEIVIPLMVFCVFALIHVFGLVKKSRIEAERAKIYTAMLTSTFQILNNFLDQMRLFQTEARNTPGFDPEIISKFDDTIEKSLEQIKNLAKVSHIDEISIRESMRTNYN